MKQFYVITNRHKDPELLVTNRIKKYIEERGGNCTIQVKEPSPRREESYTDSAWLPDETECMLVLGGDGTMLQAARDTVEKQIPILGINMGTVGYLAEIELPGIESALDRLLNDDYMLEERMMLIGTVKKEGAEPEEDYALNDIAITRSGSLQIIKYSIYVNDLFLYSYSADGVMVATPTGSTGYNLSAGGPIVEPKAKLLLITPICPHTLNTRSIVLGADDRITIEINAGREGEILEVEANFDGSHKVTLRTGDRIEIRQSEKKTNIIKLSNVSFLEVLHKKMNEK
ncbi:MAG: NAD(+)/NADH kinase [Lachnospiraceae bacterium]|nr:NAD(+)/NADH kinase [Lachnospiraceae bacterium]